MVTNEEGTVAGLWIGAVLRRAAFLAFEDRAGLYRNQPARPFDRPEGGPPFLRHQHRNRSSLRVLDEILEVCRRPALITQSRDSELRCPVAIWIASSEGAAIGNASASAAIEIPWKPSSSPTESRIAPAGLKNGFRSNSPMDCVPPEVVRIGVN